jgi:hypothetical protein
VLVKDYQVFRGALTHEEAKKARADGRISVTIVRAESPRDAAERAGDLFSDRARGFHVTVLDIEGDTSTRWLVKLRMEAEACIEGIKPS